MQYRAEFELLWQNSREFGHAFAFSIGNPTPDSLLVQSGDHPGRNAYFTSANYRSYISSTYGPTFAKISGSQVVADKVVELINQATQSIQIDVPLLNIGLDSIVKYKDPSKLTRPLYIDNTDYYGKEDAFERYSWLSSDACQERHL